MPEREKVGTLPARNLSEVAAADLLAQSGCPVCRVSDQGAQAFLESVLSELVNDVPFRRRLDEARGFCRPHTHGLLAAERKGRGGTLGSSILFEAILAIRAPEVRAAHEARGRTRTRRLGAAARAPGCPACAAAAGAEARFVGTVLARAGDPAWQEALVAAAFCLDHVLTLMAVAPPSDAWRTIETRQLERMEALRDRAGSFAHRSSHDRRHLVTDDERRAADDAAEFLGGTNEP